MHSCKQNKTREELGKKLLNLEKQLQKERKREREKTRSKGNLKQKKKLYSL